MRDRRVDPLRLIPTVKIGESVENFDEVGFPRLVRALDTKKTPQSGNLLFRRSPPTSVQHFLKLRFAMDQSKRFFLSGVSGSSANNFH